MRDTRCWWTWPPAEPGALRRQRKTMAAFSQDGARICITIAVVHDQQDESDPLLPTCSTSPWPPTSQLVWPPCRQRDGAANQSRADARPATHPAATSLSRRHTASTLAGN